MINTRKPINLVAHASDNTYRHVQKIPIDGRTPSIGKGSRCVSMTLHACEEGENRVRHSIPISQVVSQSHLGLADEPTAGGRWSLLERKSAILMELTHFLWLLQV